MTRLLTLSALFLTTPCVAIDDMLTVAASTSGGMQAETSWYFSMNSDGAAVLSVGTVKPFDARFTVSKVQRQSLIDLVKETDAVYLPEEYGTGAPGDVVRSLIVVINSRSLRFRFYGMEENQVPNAKLGDLKKAMKVRHLVRSWLDGISDLPEALDFRKYELDAVKRVERTGR